MTVSPHSLPNNKTVAIASTQKIYTVGTLRYTLRGVLILFAWLLGGDFAFSFFESVFSKFLPLYLNDLHASNTLIGSMGSIAGAVNIFLGPSISQWSDRCRTRWGRRIPFLAAATPLTVISLILIGFAPEIGGWLHRQVILHVAPSVSVTVVILTFLSVCVAFFHYFNMVLCNAFTWLLKDVVPEVLIGRILSWFRIVSTLSAMAFNFYVFPYVLTYRKEVCVGVGLFYALVFLMMCSKVKEGEYAPVPVEEKKPGIFKSFILYFQECLSIPIYRHYFYSAMLNSFASCSGAFIMLFYRNNLHLSMDQIGTVFTWGLAVSALANLPMGWLCDRCNPFRVVISAVAGIFTLNILSFFYIHDFQTLMIFNVLTSFISAGFGLGNGAMSMRLFPSQKFGQFSTAVNIFAMGIGIAGNTLVGLFMDLMHSNYRMAYLWMWIGGLSLIPLVMVYRGWQKHGGPDHYIAPLLSK